MKYLKNAWLYFAWCVDTCSLIIKLSPLFFNLVKVVFSFAVWRWKRCRMLKPSGSISHRLFLCILFTITFGVTWNCLGHFYDLHDWKLNCYQKFWGTLGSTIMQQCSWCIFVSFLKIHTKHWLIFTQLLVFLNSFLIQPVQASNGSGGWAAF